MRLMTGIAGDVAHMIGGDDLGETLGLGRIFLVAAAAKGGNVRQLGLDRTRIIGVLCLRTVASLAGHVGVPATGARFGFVVMTGHAGILAREGDWPLPDSIERTRAIVTILAESLGDYRLAHQQKHDDSGNQDRHQPQKVRSIVSSAAHFESPFGFVRLPRQVTDQKA